MKKSDLPWMLPLLTAWSQGKTLQLKHPTREIWWDWDATFAPDFSLKGGAADYRIKPELKTPGQVAWENCGDDEECRGWNDASQETKDAWNKAAHAVIKAYKACELDFKE